MDPRIGPAAGGAADEAGIRDYVGRRVPYHGTAAHRNRAAAMTAEQIARRLGGARREGRNWRCICPLHGGRSLMLRDGCDKLLVKCWAGCEWRDVLAELRRLHLLDGAGGASPLPDDPEERLHRARRQAIARIIWGEARDARGTPVARYLKGRGITIAPARLVALGAALLAPGGTRRPAGDGGARRRAGRRAARHSPDLD